VVRFTGPGDSNIGLFYWASTLEFQYQIETAALDRDRDRDHLWCTVQGVDHAGVEDGKEHYERTWVIPVTFV
jgi:hypothetical protein